MDAYYNQYFQGRKVVPKGSSSSQPDQEDENSTHYQAGAMMSDGQRKGYNYSASNDGGGGGGGGPGPSAQAQAAASAAFEQIQQAPTEFQQQDQTSSMAPITNSKIYVANMPADHNERKLTEVFGRYGDILSITHKGSYAFIEYAEPGMADDAISEMRASNSQLRVQLAFIKGNPGGAFGGGPEKGAGGYSGVGRGAGRGAGGGDSTDAPFKQAGNIMSGGNNCFRCGEDGHWASSCPMNGGMGRGQPGMGPSFPSARETQKCYNCQESGHWARECPKPASGRGGGGGGRGRGGYSGGGGGGGYGGGRGGGGYGGNNF